VTESDKHNVPHDQDWTYMEQHWFQLRDYILSDFRTLAVSDKALKLIGSNNGSILDLGCGAGTFVAHALKAGFDVHGIDVSHTQINLARDLLTRSGLSADRVQCSALEDLIVTSQKYDACTALDVIEHIEDRIPVIRQVRDILSLGGRFIVSVPAEPTLYNERDRESGHYLRYDAQTLRQELEAGGFVVERLQFWNFLGRVHRGFHDLTKPNQPATYKFRYSASASARFTNVCLRYYFKIIENTFSPPRGMSLFAIARRADET
jgi:2-polyprenyl-3-methyl-5-hydroxy-6-metoxy-1,4-benzoquinol methylase